VTPSERTIAAFRRQLREHGEASLRKSKRSLEDQLDRHEEKLKRLEGERYASSVEREIRTFRRQIIAIEYVLEEVQR